MCLARALLTDPDVLLLDDATSAVDAVVEAEIHRTLRRVMAGRTTILIAHRRSTLSLADRIAVLDQGRVVDSGTHDELQQRCALYRDLLSGTTASPPPAAPRDLPTKLPDRPQAGVSGPMARHLAGLPPTPELLAQVEALPPARDRPSVDPAVAEAPDPAFTLARLLRTFAAPLLASLLLVALTAAATLTLPALIRYGLDHGVQRGSMGVIGVVSAIGLAVVGGYWLVLAGQTLVTGRTGERLLYTLRVKAFAHLQRLGLDFYEREMSGRIMTRMTTDIDALATFLQTGLATTVVSLLSLVGVAVAMLVINAQLGLVVLSILPVLVVATLIFRARSTVAYNQARDKVSLVNADLQENVAGLRVTQAYRREDHNRSRFAALSDDYRAVRLRGQRYLALYFPFVQLLSHVAALLTLVVGARMVDSDALTAGALIAYLLYIDLLFSPVQQLSQVFDSYQQAAVGLRRIRELLRTPTSTPPPPRPLPVPDRLAGEVAFDGVQFHYAPDAGPALAGIDLTIAPGETIAVEAYLFPGTVRDAIAYGRPAATDAEVAAAARAVGADSMIATLSGGYDHLVGERGRNLSSGQRQLLALARAQLVDPDILLLDEATAALDLATEAAVTRATERLTGRRTTLVVAHRLTTAARADRIVVLERGRVAEIGSHAELLAAGGHYASMWRTFNG